MLLSHGWTLKQKPWREALNVPLIIRYPQRIKAGQVRDMPVASVDLVPTLLGLCGRPQSSHLDGRDLSDLLMGTSEDEPDSVFVMNHGTARNSPGAEWRAVQTSRYLYAATAQGDWLLFDLRSGVLC